MLKPDKSLFQIGKAAKMMGVSRKMILNYENLGLLQAAYQDPDSGYRYYTVDNLTQIRAIRSLQTLGLSLTEVREYYYDTGNLEAHIGHLIDLRNTLDRNIQLLRARAAKRGDLTVHWTVLSRRVCFVRRVLCADVKEASVRLRETCIEAAQAGYCLSKGERLFTQRVGDTPDSLDILFCIPLEEEQASGELMVFPEMSAASIYYRGPYEGLPDIYRRLARHTRENGIETTGGIQTIYLEGPPSRGTNTADYITQVAIPVVDRRQSL